MSFQQTVNICSINHHGVQLLQNGDFDGAISSFTQALSMIRTTYREDDAEYANVLKQKMEREIIMIEGHSKSPLNLPLFQSDVVMGSSSSSFVGFVYHEPIELPADTTIPLQAYSIGVMFNLALSFQLKGISYHHHPHHHHHHHHTTEQEGTMADNSHDRTGSLQRAVDLYELCYEMMASERINPGLCFIMAIANNLGHLHNMLQSCDKARHCFEHLLSIQMFIMEYKQGRDDDNSSNEEQVGAAAWEGFCRNTSGLILDDCCASAA